MPGTSKVADKLADDLVEVGRILGFEPKKEAPVKEGSMSCVDILWRFLLPIKNPFPIPNIASIEIQYSDSPASISHNIFKAEPTLHPALHIVISYNALSSDYKEILRRSYPAGLAIFEGVEGIKELNDWIAQVIASKGDTSSRLGIGKEFLKFINEKKTSERMDKSDTLEYPESLFDPVVYEITVVSQFTKESGTFSHTYFITGTIEKAKEKVLQRHEEDMNDMPIEWEGQYVSLKKLRITCYQLWVHNVVERNIEERVIYKVVLKGRVGSEDNYFEFTENGFGVDPKQVEKGLYEELNTGIERMKSLPHTILEDKAYFAKYREITSWEIPIEGEVLLLSKTVVSKEEQKEKKRLFFSKEFGLEVEDFLSLNDIYSNSRYFENLDYIKDRLSEIFKEDKDSFRDRINEDDYRRLEKWLYPDEFI